MNHSIKSSILLFVCLALGAALAGLTLITSYTVTRGVVREEQNDARTILDLLMGNIQKDYDALVDFKLDFIGEKSTLLSGLSEMYLAQLSSFVNMEEEGVMTRLMAQTAAMSILRSISVENDVEYFIMGKDFTGLLHQDESLVGRSWVGFHDLPGRDVFKSILESLKDVENGFTVMSWDRGKERGKVRKSQVFVHYARFEPWDWVVGVYVSMSSMEEELAEQYELILTGLEDVLSDLMVGPGSQVLLMNGQGEMLYPPSGDSPEWWNSELEQKIRDYATGPPLENGSSGLGADMGERQVYVQYFKPLDWYLCYAISKADLARPSQGLLNKLLPLYLLLFVLCLAGIYWAVNRTTRPMKTLTSLVEQATFNAPEQAKGQSVSPPESGEDVDEKLRSLYTGHRNEAGRLAAAFSMMLTSLRKYLRDLDRNRQELEASHQVLETRVEERTRELRQVNRSLREEVLIRKQAQTDLRMSLDQLQGILDHSPFLISLKDKSGKYILVNRFFAKFHGITPQEARGKNLDDLFPGDDVQALKEGDKEVLETGKPVSMEFTVILRGRSMVYNVAKFPLLTPEGDVWSIGTIGSDMTEARSFQAEALRASQLASIGELAAGIAHEINNPINGIINYAELLLEEGLDPEVTRSIPRRIIKESQRIAFIVRNLLSFARSKEEDARPVNIREVIDDSLALMRSQMEKEGIRVKVDVAQDIPLVMIKEGEIRQVLINLLSNSRASLNAKYPNGSADKYLRLEGHEQAVGQEGFVRIIVEDNGEGIAEKNLKRLFDPFFTTRPDGQGTGLGLSISRRIIREHGGEIRLESPENDLTRAIIDLPVFRKD